MPEYSVSNLLQMYRRKMLIKPEKRIFEKVYFLENLILKGNFDLDFIRDSLHQVFSDEPDEIHSFIDKIKSWSLINKDPNGFHQ